MEIIPLKNMIDQVTQAQGSPLNRANLLWVMPAQLSNETSNYECLVSLWYMQLLFIYSDNFSFIP